VFAPLPYAARATLAKVFTFIAVPERRRHYYLINLSLFRAAREKVLAEPNLLFRPSALALIFVLARAGGGGAGKSFAYLGSLRCVRRQSAASRTLPIGTAATEKGQQSNYPRSSSAIIFLQSMEVPKLWLSSKDVSCFHSFLLFT
jgi:hypothetical protein